MANEIGYERSREVGVKGVGTTVTAQHIIHEVLREKRETVRSNLNCGSLLNGLHKFYFQNHGGHEDPKDFDADKAKKQWNLDLRRLGISSDEADNLRRISVVDAFWNDNIVGSLPHSLKALSLLTDPVFHENIPSRSIEGINDSDLLHHCVAIGCLSAETTTSAVQAILDVRKLNNWAEELHRQHTKAKDDHGDKPYTLRWRVKKPDTGSTTSKKKTLFTLRIEPDSDSVKNYDALVELENKFTQMQGQLEEWGFIVEKSKASDDSKIGWFKEDKLSAARAAAVKASNMVNAMSAVTDKGAIGAAVATQIKKANVVQLLMEEPEHQILSWMRGIKDDSPAIKRLYDGAYEDVKEAQAKQNESPVTSSFTANTVTANTIAANTAAE